MRIVALALIFALWLVSVANATPYGDEIISQAESYLYVREQTNRNDHPKIDEWMLSLGLNNKAQIRETGCGYAWCMGFSQGMYTEIYKSHGKKNPLPKSASCSQVYKMAKKDKYRYKVFTAKQVETGAIKLKKADVMICSHNRTSEDFLGHTGAVREQLDRYYFFAVEGNTGPSNLDSEQREQTGISKVTEKNGGVRIKQRTVKKGSKAFRVEGFIRTLDQ